MKRDWPFFPFAPSVASDEGLRSGWKLEWDAPLLQRHLVIVAAVTAPEELHELN